MWSIAKNSRVLAGLLIFFSLGPAFGSEEIKRLAKEIPIFDMHMHVYPGLTPNELESRMNRNGVQWGGGVGAINPQVEIAPFKALLGKRYYPTIGQAEMAASFSRGGVGAMSNPENPMMMRALSLGENLFPKREAFGFGELILNNETSSASPPFRRQAKVDSPVVRRMFAIADQHGMMIQIHIEPAASSLAGLKSLLAEFPKVPVVIAHCLSVTKGPQEIESLFSEFAQVYCELSSRSKAHISHRPEIQIYGGDFAKPEWVASIEKYADRYMLGTDISSDASSYDEEIRQIRSGLLPRLTAATLVKVAHQNAKRLMKVVE